MVREGTREAKVVGSNPDNARKNRATCDASAVGNFFFIYSENTYFNMQKNDVRHLCVDIGDGLRLHR